MSDDLKLVRRKAGIWTSVGPRAWGTTLNCGHYAEIHNVPLVHREGNRETGAAPDYEPALPEYADCGLCSLTAC